MLTVLKKGGAGPSKNDHHDLVISPSPHASDEFAKRKKGNIAPPRPNDIKRILLHKTSSKKPRKTRSANPPQMSSSREETPCSCGLLAIIVLPLPTWLYPEVVPSLRRRLLLPRRVPMVRIRRNGVIHITNSGEFGTRSTLSSLCFRESRGKRIIVL